MSQQESLVDLTRRQFDLQISDPVAVEPIEKGGSDRRFYRITVGGKSLILVRYGGQKEENRHYVSIADFLEDIGVRVPHIYYHDDREGLIWMQDLGGVDLWSYRNEPAATKLAYYESALRQVFCMHSRGMAYLPGSKVTLQKEFSAELYRWEQHYFFQHCVGRFFGVTETEWNQWYESPLLIGMADKLAALPRVLVHRDFQSQNVMILEGDAYLIDFQGMRPGLAQYDLASLLLDPYTDLTAAEREHLVAFYLGLLRELDDVDEAAFWATYWEAATQRLMQALGAYGFLGLECERPRFLEFIPVALPRLLQVMERVETPGIDRLRQFVAGLAQRAPQMPHD